MHDIDIMKRMFLNRSHSLTISLIFFIQFIPGKNIPNNPNFAGRILHKMKKANILNNDQKRVAQLAKAMSHPVRIYVLEILSNQSCCYSGDLSEELPIAKSTLSQHLKELKNAGLIQGEIEPPKIKYCLNRKVWEEAQILFKDFFDKKMGATTC